MGAWGAPSGTPTTAGKGAAVEGSEASAPDDGPTKTYGLMCVVKDRTPATNLDPQDTVPSWPYLLRAEILVFMFCFLVVLGLGLFFDAPLKEMANPSIPENPAKAPWYFLGLQEMVSYSAFMGGLLIPAIIMLGLMLIPYLDREKEEAGIYLGTARAKAVALQSVIFATIVSVISVAIPVSFGWLRDWFPSIPQLVIILINPGSLLTIAFALWSVQVVRRENSTRLAAIALFTCFLVGFAILTYVGSEMRRAQLGLLLEQVPVAHPLRGRS